MIWKVLIFAIAAYALYRLFMNDQKKKSDDGRKERDDLIAKGELVKDPQCGTYVDKEYAAATLRNGEEVLYFCSHDCRSAYMKSLEQ